jgi:hypothetical protein
MWITPDWGVIEEDPGVKGSARITTGCLWRHFPRWLGIMIAQTNRPAAAMESARNTMADMIDVLRKDVARVNRVMVALQMQRDGQMLPGLEGQTNGHGAIEHQPEED